MMNAMNVKCKFTIDEVIGLTENCYYVTADDVVDLCDLRDVGFENIRWVKDLFTEFGGCWIAEKDDYKMYEADCDDSKHGGMVVCLSVRVGRMLDEYCKNEDKDEDRKIRNYVEDLMYDLHESLDKWNGNNMRNVNRIIFVLEDLGILFKRIRDKQIER